MNTRITFALVGLTAVTLLVSSACNPWRDGQDKKHRVTGDDELPVYPDMLIGAQYTGSAPFHSLKWTFDAGHFEIVAAEEGIPDDLMTSLLPEGTTANRIAGRWEVEGEQLTLFDITADGVAIEQPPRKLRTMYTGVLRIEAGSQYKFRRGPVR